MRALSLLAALAVIPLSGCDWVQNVSGLNAEAHQALGASCRQTGRSLEECFRRNPKADQAMIFAGWKSMNEYMAKHKLETVEPPPDPPKPVATKSEGKPEVVEEELDPEVKELMSTLGNKRTEAAALERKKEERLISIIDGTTERVNPNERLLPETLAKEVKEKAASAATPSPMPEESALHDAEVDVTANAKH